MVVDIRANMLCSLGTVLSGEISDDLLTEGGLIKTNGTIVLDGILLPAKGARVELAYHRPQVNLITRFPRTLRVLRATADPYANRSTLEVGCMLSLKDSVKQADAQYRTSYGPVIYAQSVLEYCLNKVGIQLHSASQRLTFRLLRESIDLSGGFLSVASDLIKSECCYGALTVSEMLLIKKINLSAAMTAAVLTDDNLIELSPITGGDEPSDNVVVSVDAFRRS